MRYWPHRCGAVGIEDYMRAFNVDINNPQTDKDLLLIMELYVNLLHWAPKQDYIDDKSPDFILLKKDEIDNESDRLIQNAEYILEQCCNMTIREEDDDAFPKYHITKRNVFVDAAVSSVPSLSDYLLGYFDVRNQDDLKYKKEALTAIYGYMEPKRKEYKGMSCSAIAEEFFACMNTIGIRHNTKSQIKLTTKKKKSVCDKMFMIAVYILQTQDVNTYKDELKQIREG